MAGKAVTMHDDRSRTARLDSSGNTTKDRTSFKKRSLHSNEQLLSAITLLSLSLAYRMVYVMKTPPRLLRLGVSSPPGVMPPPTPAPELALAGMRIAGKSRDIATGVWRGALPGKTKDTTTPTPLLSPLLTRNNDVGRGMCGSCTGVVV